MAIPRFCMTPHLTSSNSPPVQLSLLSRKEGAWVHVLGSHLGFMSHVTGSKSQDATADYCGLTSKVHVCCISTFV